MPYRHILMASLNINPLTYLLRRKNYNQQIDSIHCPLLLLLLYIIIIIIIINGPRLHTMRSQSIKQSNIKFPFNDRIVNFQMEEVWMGFVGLIARWDTEKLKLRIKISNMYR